MKRVILRTLLLGLGPLLDRAARGRPAFRAFAKRHDAVVQMQLKDGSIGRWFEVRAGRIRSHRGLHPNPGVRMMFKDVDTALTMMRPNPDMGEVVHAAKNFKVMVVGPDALCVWWMQLLNLSQSSALRMGTPLPDRSTRFTMLTNGGPLFVHVRDGRIVRTVPIEFDTKDAPSWTIQARGHSFSPRRMATVATHALAMKAAVYSDKRILHPMKRVDFDPNGERNPSNRGKSGYVRIGWDEALDIVAGEILRQRRVHGPGAMTIVHGSHHQWGNVGYYLSSLMRFGNLVGFTRVAANPDSWEGWYWGAMHHWGQAQRVGISGTYGLVGPVIRRARVADTPGTKGRSVASGRANWACSSCTLTRTSIPRPRGWEGAGSPSGRALTRRSRWPSCRSGWPMTCTTTTMWRSAPRASKPGAIT